MNNKKIYNQQIFEKKNWVKKHNIKFKIKLSKMNLPLKLTRIINSADKYNLITKNLVYLLRMNNENENLFFDYYLLIKLLIAQKFIYDYKKFKYKKYYFILETVIHKLFTKLKVNTTLNLNLEKEIINNEEYLSINKLYCNNHYFCDKIANIFYFIFIDHSDCLLYYKYTYYLAMLLCFNFVNLKLNSLVNYKIYKIKLKIMQEYQSTIMEINPFLFNYFIKQNNRFSSKNKFK